MSSEVDVCNLALSHLGDEASLASIDPPEGSAQADHCAKFYPIARDLMLEKHPWKFATRRVLLSPVDVDLWEWGYAYAEPNNCARLLSVLPQDAPTEADTQEYEAMSAESGASVILTDQEEASLVYIHKVTDTSKFPALFVYALSRLLASYLAGPVLKGEAGTAQAKEQLRLFMLALGEATTSDANQRRVRLPDHVPSSITARL